MQNKQEQQRRVTKNTLREITYLHEWRQRHTSSPKDDDCYMNGELLTAAAILIDLAASRAKQRDLVVAAKAMVDAQKGEWDYNNGSYQEAGYPAVPEQPPANWPLKKEDWPVGSQQDLVQKVTQLMVAEAERAQRAQRGLWRSNFNTLDDEARELSERRAEISDKRYRAARRRASKEVVLMNVPVDSAVLSSHNGQVAYDTALGSAIDFSSIQPQAISQEEEYDELDNYIEVDDDC